MSGPEEKGTGLVFSMLVGWVHAFHAGVPLGGSGMLVEALVRPSVGGLRYRADFPAAVDK